GDPSIPDPWTCPEPGLADGYTGDYQITITAPSGAIGNFMFSPVQHWRSAVPEFCIVTPPDYYYLIIPRYSWSYSLISKSVSGPGIASMTWNYSYGQPDPFGGSTKMNTVTGPGINWSRHTYGTAYEVNEGQLLQIERGSGSSVILMEQENQHITSAQAIGQSFPESVGVNPQLYSDRLASAWLRPIRKSTVTQQGSTFD